METVHADHPTGRDGLFWLGILGPPLVWFSQLTFNFVVSHHACHARTKVPFWGGSAVALVLVLIIVALVFRVGLPLHRMKVKDEYSRPRSMAQWAMISSGFFTLVVLATTLPALVMNPCD